MNIAIFNKTYLVRRFEDQKIVRGYITSPHTDFYASLNVHPASSDTLQALPEGERKIKRLEGHGTDVLRAADADRGIRGDLLYYHGDWYECTSALEYDHTILSHLNYTFTLVPKDAAGTIDLDESDEDEDDSDDGGDEDESE